VDLGLHSSRERRPVPDDWAAMVAGVDCPMCRAIGQGDDHFGLVVVEGRFAEVHLRRRTRLPGYCVVIWNHEHVAEPSDLEPDRAAGYWQEVMEVGRAVRAVFTLVKLNYFTLGNTVPHLHTHVLPRYQNDPAPGGPIHWGSIASEEPVPEDLLRSQAATLLQLITP
jgi:diadenosine tetraphosphate (Ap4A) HIT family hydrolase